MSNANYTKLNLKMWMVVIAAEIADAMAFLLDIQG